MPTQKEHLDSVQAALSARSDEATKLDQDGLIQPFAAPEDSFLWVFVSYAWLNQEEHEVQTEFLNRLDENLRFPPATFQNIPKIKLWRDTSQIRASDQGDPQIDTACQQASIALLMISNKYPHSNVCQREVSFFLTDDGKNKPDKFCIGVPVNVDLNDIPNRYTNSTRLLLFGPKGENLVALWSRGGKADRAEFVKRAANEIFLAAKKLVESPAPARQLGTPFQRPVEKFFYDRRVIDTQSMVEPRASIGTTSPRIDIGTETPAPVLIIDHLVDWATEAVEGGPRLVAILGEFGMGKTVACQMFTQRLLDIGREAQTALPIYFDLRDVDRIDHEGPKLEVLIDQMLRKAGETAPSAHDTITFARERGAIIIFDGLDELTNKMSTQAAIRLYRELLAIVPSDLWIKDAFDRRKIRIEKDHKPKPLAGPRIVISCRTHYFRDVSAQRAFLTGMERSPIDADADYKVYLMLPFTGRQIVAYLNLHFSTGEAARAFELIQKTYNLRELAERPILLRFIRETFARLENEKLLGRTINLTRLYDIFVDQVLERDNPKHTIPIPEKKIILRSLALYLHLRGSNEISNDKLDEWLRKSTSDVPLLAAALSSGEPISLSELFAQDLRNASLLVRPGDRTFSFAHTSVREYFLASALHTAVMDGMGENVWNIKMPTPEAITFLLQRHELQGEPEHRLFEANFAALLEENRPENVRGLAFEVWLKAKQGALPRPPRIDLSNLDLKQHRMAGTPGAPLALENSTWHNTNLQDAEFENVSLDGADFTSAKANRSKWLSCSLGETNFSNADLSATTWRNCALSPQSLQTARTDSARAIECGYADVSWRPQGAPPPDAAWIVRSLATRRNNRNYIVISALENSSRFLAVSRDGTIRIYDLVSMDQITLHIARAERSAVCGVTTFGAQRKFAAASTIDGHVAIFDIQTKQQIAAIREERSEERTTVSYSTVRLAEFENRLYVTGNFCGIFVIDPQSGLLPSCWAAPRAKSAALGECEGQMIALLVDYDDTINLYNPTTGNLARTIPPLREAINCVDTGSLDGATIGILGSAHGMIDLFDLSSGSRIQTIDAEHRSIASLALAELGGETCVLSGHEAGLICVHGVHSKRCLAKLQSGQQTVVSLAICSEGGSPTIVSGGDDGVIRAFSLSAFDLNEKAYINHETGSFVRLGQDLLGCERLLQASSNAWRDFSADYRSGEEMLTTDIADMLKGEKLASA